MGYVSRFGRRPNEYASKSSHGYIIRDPDIQYFLSEECELPTTSEDVEFSRHTIVNHEQINPNPIQHIFTFDGGYTEVAVKKEFPSSTVSFFQFGASAIRISDLEEISYKPFIDPADMEKLKTIERFKLTLPTKNVTLKSESDLINSVRKTIYNFFMNQPKGEKENFLSTLKWFIFEEYNSHPNSTWNLASCPSCSHSNIEIKRSLLDKDFSIKCPNCRDSIYLTDVFRLHEAIDNELGAGGILGYLTNLLEHILLIHIIKSILSIQQSLLKNSLFLKDGPLAFFGQTANLHKPMRKLVVYLKEHHNIYMAGLEKSGAFVEHAHEISQKLKPGSVLLLDNDYIYKYIIPGKADSANPYARSSYYGAKVIFKSRDERMYVVTLPTKDADIILKPKKDDYFNIDIVLQNIEKLKCDMYENALIPIALVNKLVSLSNHPSSVILEKFAKKSIC